MKHKSTPTASTSSPAVPETLDRHLSANAGEDLPSLARYIDRGAALVTPEAIKALSQLREPLQVKLGTLRESQHLRRRVEILARYFEEAYRDGHRGSAVHCEVAFALLYFLKGFDRIPDSIPEVGLLDDAMIVQAVLQRHLSTLRAHWLRHHRMWPADL
jgi:uncharacterized membrane protein YkvA (DUF1232 family)